MKARGNMQPWLDQLFNTPVGQWLATDIVGVLVLGLVVLSAFATISTFSRAVSGVYSGRMLGPGAGRPR
jgi:hypothetical protein